MSDDQTHPADDRTGAAVPGSRGLNASVPGCDLLVVSPHPDDAEIGCGGAMALAARGRRVWALELTRGELGSNATVDERWAESVAAADVLGLTGRLQLSLPDGFVSAEDPAQVAPLVDALRRLRPRWVVTAPDPRRHPDHVATPALVTKAAFLARLAAYRGALGAHRLHGPASLPAPAERWELEAQFAVCPDDGCPAAYLDITAWWDRKRAALDCHASQFRREAGRRATAINDPDFLARIEQRARHWGRRAGVGLAEALCGAAAPVLDDLTSGEVALMRMPAIGITCYPSQGGSGVVASELGLHLARRGCEVHFISSHLPFRLQQYNENVIHHPVDMPQYPVFVQSPYTLTLASTMSEVALRCGLDLLHVHYAIPHAASAYLAKQMVAPRPLPVVTTLHGTDITLVGQEPSFFPMTRFMIEQSDAVTAVSRFLKDETIRVFGTGEQIEVIPNFVDARVFRPREDDERRRRFAPAGEKLLLHASNFRKVKNVEAVVDVFAGVAAALPARLLLVGDGPEMPAVRARVAACGLQDRVQLLGQVDNLEDVVPVADLLLLPSRHESFGLVALEAMACGVVPLATSRGGAGEFIQDGVNGFLCDPDDVPGMVDKAVRALRDDHWRAQLAEDARRDAAGDFGVSCVVRQYLDLYDRLLAAGSLRDAAPRRDG